VKFQKILVGLFLISNIVLGSELPTCKEAELSLIGFYGDKGEHASPLLDSWSEESGNLRALKIKSKNEYTKLQYFFYNNDKNLVSSIEIKLTKNRSSKFDFNKTISSLKVRPNLAFIKIYNKDGNPYCHLEQKIIEIDGQDGVVKNVK
jgi:hypothetical protein